MAVVIANARQSVLAPTRTARRFGLFSVANLVDGGEQHWILGGVVADGEQCSEPLEGLIVCGPTAAKTSRSWYSDIQGDPWLAYMYETCKSVGRVDESAAKLRQRFTASEEAAAEAGFQAHVLTNAFSWGAFPTVAQAIGKLEQEAGEVYGGQITLHLPFLVAEEASRQGLLTRYGAQLETVTGSLVSVGNYRPDLNGGSNTAPVLYATGGVTLFRSGLVETGPVFGSGAGNVPNNDYYTLIERAYAGIVDCFMASATTSLCDCGGGAGGI